MCSIGRRDNGNPDCECDVAKFLIPLKMLSVLVRVSTAVVKYHCLEATCGAGERAHFSSWFVVFC